MRSVIVVLPRINKMKEFKIELDKEKRIGCNVCASVSDNWIMDGNKAKPKKTLISEEESKSNKEAENICPVKAIKIEE